MSNTVFIALFSALILSGCTKETSRILPAAESSRVKIDIETAQKINKILDSVRNTAMEHPLDYLGRNTMAEAVKIMDAGVGASEVLIKRLKTAYDWKFRFWIVDLMGYIPDRDNILPLIEIIEDPLEKDIIRFRACESLKELDYTKSIEQLLISMDLVEDPIVREEIRKTIESIRK